jgi:hypothetical protein
LISALLSPLRILTGGRNLPLALGGLVLMGTAMGAASVYGGAVAELAEGPVYEDAVVDGEVDGLVTRAERLLGVWSGVEELYEREIAPIERVLLRYRNDPELTSRIAVALYGEARRVELEPRLLLAVLLVENPWLNPTARSPVGAVGLMQVMPFHRGRWDPCEPDLEDIEANICHGARIFAHYFRQTGGDIDRALLRYNGCVRGANTPDCHLYPNHVFARAGRASIQAWLTPATPTRAAAP